MSVRLILDTPALHAYVAEDLRSLELGELIQNVEENGDTCGIPALCLLAALKVLKTTDQAKLLDLTRDDDGPAVVLPVMAPAVAAIAGVAAHMSDDHAQAVIERARHDAPLGTYGPSVYGDFVTEDDILNLGQF